MLALLMGVVMSIYLPMNSSVSKHLGSPITANVTFFLVALITSIFIFFVFGKVDTISKLKDVPVYLYVTGVISAFIVLGTTFLIPHIGARKCFILMISGQIVMSMVVSHFGLLTSPQDPITIKKIIGASFVISGSIISTN